MADPEVRTVDLDWRSVLVLFASFVVMTGLFGLARAIPRSLTWIVIGAVLALALNPLVLAIEQRLHCRRGVALAIIIGALVLAVAALTYLLGPETVRQARALRDDIPDIVAQLQDLPVLGSLIGDESREQVESWLSELPDHLAGESTQIENAARRIVSGLLAGFVVFLVIVTFLLDGSHLGRRARRLVPLEYRERADDIGGLLYRLVGRYFGGSVLVAVLHGLAVLIVGIILGVPLTPLLAVWVTIWSLVPQIGGAVGGVPFVVFALTQGAVVGLIAAVFFVVYLLFENHVLTPLIVGDAVDLSPPSTMVAAIVGVAVAGLPGALIGVPLLGAAKALYIEVRDPDRALAEHEARLARNVPVWKFWRKVHR